MATGAQESLTTSLCAYLPMDRRLALAAGEVLPERAEGAVLFADISGFTPLTETLVRELGPQRGVEEISRRLDAIFDALIREVHRYGGSVVSFGGDAVLCWLPDDDGLRAVACAQRCHQAMARFARVDMPSGAQVQIALKTAVAVGPVRRLAVGDPGILRLEVLAGETVDRVARAERLARPGEIIVDGRSQRVVGEGSRIVSWRHAESGDAFAVVSGAEAPERPWPRLPLERLSEAELRPWMPQPIFERFQRGQGRFVAESRLAAVLFLSFGGLDFDRDEEVGGKLDAYVRWVQSVLAHYEGTLLHLGTADKGTHLFAAFGAPLAHEDDADRALAAALELRTPPPELSFVRPVRIGLSWGRLYAGDYGSATRRTYALLGDETNLAAHIMAQAPPHHILATGRVLQAALGRYEVREMGQLPLKGVQASVPLFEVLSRQQAPQRATQRQRTEIVGRHGERELLAERLQALLQQGESCIVAIEGDAGIGKSRLLTDLLEHTRFLGLDTRLIAGDAVDRATAYFPWRPFFRELLGLAEAGDPEAVRAGVYRLLEALDPGLVEQAPLLNAVLPLELPETELTAAMAGQARAVNTNTLLLRLLAASAGGAPLVLAVEDAHWLDSASWALLRQVRDNLTPLLLIVATRPLDPTDPGSAPLVQEYRRILEGGETRHLQLGALAPEEVLTLVCHRLGVHSLPEPVAELIRTRAEGHPFFSEELAYALRDTGLIEIREGECRLAPGAGDLRGLEFPDTVQGVITSRIDRLPAPQQLVLKVASIIGRVFAFALLRDVHPVAEDRSHLLEYLAALERLDLTPLESPEPDLAYIFKHIITQEVAYQLMTFSQRRELHGAVAEWHERVYTAELPSYYPVLAHHWSRAEHRERALRYHALAGEQALGRYANQEAAEFLERAIDLADEPDGAGRGGAEDRLERARWNQQLAEARFRLGHFPESDRRLRYALELLGRPVPGHPARVAAGLLRQLARQARIRLGLARARRGGASEADRLAYHIYERFTELSFANNDLPLTFYGTVHSLAIAEAMGPSSELAHAYAKMCLVFGAMPVHRIARRYQQLSLALLPHASELARADVLWSISIYTAGIGAWEETEAKLAAAVEIFERLGQWNRLGIALEVISRVAYNRGQFGRLVEIAERLTAITQRTEDLLQRSWVYLNRLEHVLFASDEGAEALPLAERALALIEQTKEVGTVMMGNALLAVTQLRLRHTEAALLAADRALEVISSSKTASFGMYVAHVNTTAVYLALWEAHAEPGPQHHRRQALRAIAALGRFARVFSFARPRALLCQGQQLWLEGNAAKARRLWEEAHTLAERLELPYEAALADYEIGRHLPAGAAERAEHLQRAARGFLRLGAQYDLSRAEAALGTGTLSPPGSSHAKPV